MTGPNSTVLAGSLRPLACCHVAPNERGKLEKKQKLAFIDIFSKFEKKKKTYSNLIIFPYEMKKPFTIFQKELENSDG